MAGTSLDEPGHDSDEVVQHDRDLLQRLPSITSRQAERSFALFAFRQS
jgi:hypothetical protein